MQTVEGKRRKRAGAFYELVNSTTLTFRSGVGFTILVGLVVTSISNVHIHAVLGSSIRSVVVGDVVRTGSPDLGDGDGRNGHK